MKQGGCVIQAAKKFKELARLRRLYQVVDISIPRDGMIRLSLKSQKAHRIEIFGSLPVQQADNLQTGQFIRILDYSGNVNEQTVGRVIVINSFEIMKGKLIVEHRMDFIKRINPSDPSHPFYGLTLTQ